MDVYGFERLTMFRVTNRVVSIVFVSGLLAIGHAAVAGQSQPAGAIVGTGAFTVFVENMDRSLAFYHDVFSMEVPPVPASGERPYNRPNPQLFKFFDIPGARERHQSARVSGTKVAIEVMEIQDVPHKAVDLRVQDPGTAILVLTVRDIDAMLARLARASARVVTPGGRPVTIGDGARAVLVRDVDQRLLEIVQPTASASTASQQPGDVIDMSVLIAVNDLNRTIQVYRDVLGFDVQADSAFASNASARALTGLPNAEFRRARARAKDSMLDIEFVEYRGVDRKPLTMKIQDRGAARLQLRAQNIDAMVDRVKQARLAVMSEGGVAVPIPPNFKGALVADPDDFFLTLFEPCDGCAPGIAVVSR
jgi:predicted enzyme related to lactoylglutathione lyase